VKVVILAGGMGTRLQEETAVKPKPMVEIGGQPLLLHIMNIYAAQGHNEFVIALGYWGRSAWASSTGRSRPLWPWRSAHSRSRAS
jgi:NDP-sugar pyrophosphorylase family protein